MKNIIQGVALANCSIDTDPELASKAQLGAWLFAPLAPRRHKVRPNPSIACTVRHRLGMLALVVCAACWITSARGSSPPTFDQVVKFEKGATALDARQRAELSELVAKISR